MPRLDIGSTSGGSGFSIPWKALALVALIVGSIGYVAYQYVRLHPTPRPPGNRPQRVAQARKPKSPEEALKPVFDRLQLTSEQRSKVSTMAAKTTSAQALRRQVVKILTPEQKALAKQIQQEQQEENKRRQAERAAKQAKLFPGQNLEAARAGSEQIRRERAERLKAQPQSAGSTPGSSQ